MNISQRNGDKHKLLAYSCPDKKTMHLIDNGNRKSNSRLLLLLFLAANIIDNSTFFMELKNSSIAIMITYLSEYTVGLLKTLVTL